MAGSAPKCTGKNVRGVHRACDNDCRPNAKGDGFTSKCWDCSGSRRKTTPKTAPTAADVPKHPTPQSSSSHAYGLVCTKTSVTAPLPEYINPTFLRHMKTSCDKKKKPELAAFATKLIDGNTKTKCWWMTDRKQLLEYRDGMYAYCAAVNRGDLGKLEDVLDGYRKMRKSAKPQDQPLDIWELSEYTENEDPEFREARLAFNHQRYGLPIRFTAKQRTISGLHLHQLRQDVAGDMSFGLPHNCPYDWMTCILEGVPEELRTIMTPDLLWEAVDRKRKRYNKLMAEHMESRKNRLVEIDDTEMAVEDDDLEAGGNNEEADVDNDAAEDDVMEAEADQADADAEMTEAEAVVEEEFDIEAWREEALRDLRSRWESYSY